MATSLHTVETLDLLLHRPSARMPLFDAIESDVTAFFVSQGTVFDSLVKAFMDRLGLVESRVELLRTDVTNNFNALNERIDANTVAAAGVSAATAAAAAAAATSAALAALPVVEYPSPVATVVESTLDPGSGRNEKLEYYVMTLSRQLNTVLEVLFQPHGNNNVVEVVQAKQTQLHSISDVLTENEAILMQLAAQHEDWKVSHVDASAVKDQDVYEQSELNVGSPQPTPPIQAEEASKVQQPIPEHQLHGDGTPTASSDPKLQDMPWKASTQDSALEVKATEPQKPQPPHPSMQQPDTSTLPSVAAEAARHPSISQTPPLPVEPQSNQPVRSLKQVVETISPQLEASPLTKKDEVVRTVSSPTDNQSSLPKTHECDEAEEDEEERDQMPVDSSLLRPHPESSLHRTKSFFRSCQDLQRQEEARLREQRRREEELMRRMHELLLQSRSHVQHERIEEWRQQQDEATQNQQTLIFHLQGQIQEQLQLQQQREQEWRRQQEEQRHAERTAAQHEVDRKLETFSSLVAANQATQGHELAQVLQLVGDIEKRFVSSDALQAAGALWLKTAADNCIYGANPDTLSDLQRDLQGFKAQLNSHPVKSPAVSSLHEAVDRAVQLLLHPTPPSEGVPKGSQQESTMYTLRQLLAKVDSAYRAAATEHQDFQLPGVGFLAQGIHRMELGTANLLDAVDFQQENFQQMLAQHQAGLEKLQTELWRQQEVEKALRVQLGACPSKEDTLRLVQDLRDQITATAADSASRMLDTVDDLRYRMAGLPNAQTIEQLASDLHAKTERITHDLDTTTGKLAHDLRLKADRAEIDRLQSLLESSSATNAPPAYLTKSPLKCLSCDQHLPFAQAPHDDRALNPELTSNPGSPSGSPPRSLLSSPSRPIVYHNQQQPLYPYQQHAGYHQPAALYNDLGIDVGLLQELFAASTSALERRRRQRQQLQMQLLSPHTDHKSAWSSRPPTFLNIDDGRNRIPIRKVQLSDQVIYGPAITPTAVRNKRSEDTRNERPKTAALPERRQGGDIITRTSSSTVIVRPFSELADKRQKQ